MGDLTDQVRDSCRAVVAEARLVVIDEQALDRLAEQLLSGPPADAGGPAPAGASSADDVEAAVALVVALDAVNFGSGWHDVVRKRPGLSGARTMAAGLRDHVARTGGLTARRLRAMTPADAAAVFGQDLDGPAGDLMGRFARSLSELGTVIDERYDGAFVHLVEEAAGSAVALATSLADLASYRDRAELDGRTVHFYKRAQITAADLAREMPAAAACRFADLARLTAFADNLVPHVLRVEGVLRYDPSLAADIDAGVLLQPGSRAEVEIRAAGVDAVERLLLRLRAVAPGWQAMDLDLVLWLRGGGARYKAVRRHRARSLYY